MCIKKLACGLKTVVKEDGRTVLEPIFVEVDCPEDMHRITSKIESCKTVTPKIEHDGEHVDHGSYGGATNNKVSTDNKEVTTDNKEMSTVSKEVSTDSKEVSTVNKEVSTVNREVVCVETGEVFSSIRQASRATGADPSAIAKCCNGKRKTANGYQWQYV